MRHERKLFFVRMSASWLMVSTSSTWNCGSKLILSPTQSRATPWILKIGDTVRRGTYGRFSVLSEDTASSGPLGTRRLGLMSGGVQVTQLDEDASEREAPMDVFHVNMAQEADTAGLVTAPKDGFDDDPAEQDESYQRED